MTTVGLAVVLGTLIAATVIGLGLRARSGRVRDARAGGRPQSDWQRWGVTAQDGDRVLLLQLSSTVCAPCRQAAAVLGKLVEQTAGLRHVEIDIAEQPASATELGVMRTPTTVAFDRGGRELLRVSGVPRSHELAAALRPAIG